MDYDVEIRGAVVDLSPVTVGTVGDARVFLPPQASGVRSVAVGKADGLPVWDPAGPEAEALRQDLRAVLAAARFRGARLVVEYLIGVTAIDGTLATYRGRLNYARVAQAAKVSHFTVRSTGIAHPILEEFAPRFRMRAAAFDENGEEKPATMLDKLRAWLETGELVPSRGPGLTSFHGVAARIGEPYAKLEGNAQVYAIIKAAITAGKTSLDPVPWQPSDTLIEGLTPQEAHERVEELKAVVLGLSHVPEHWGRKGWIDFGYIAELTGRREPTMEGLRSYRTWVLAQAMVKKTLLPGMLQFRDTVQSFRDWGLDVIEKEQKAKGTVTWARDVANQKTNYGKLVAAAGLQPDDEVGDLFGEGFADLVVKAQGELVGESASNVVRGLERWRRLRQAKLGSANLPEGFPEALRILLRAREMTGGALAHALDMPPQTIRNWVGGRSSPSRASVPDVRRIETYFKQPAGSLVDRIGHVTLSSFLAADATEGYRALSGELRQMLPDDAATWLPPVLAAAVAKVKPLLTAGTQQGAIMRAAQSIEHRMAPFEPTPMLRSQLDKYVDYKIDKVAYPYRRAPYGRWASSASARMRMESADFFYRFMAQPRGGIDGAGGCGMGVPRGAASLAWLGHTPMVLAFTGHRAYRFRDEDWDGGSRGIFYTSQDESFVEMCASMTHAKTGWLTQHPEFAEQLVPVQQIIPPEFSDLMKLYSGDGAIPLLTAEDVAFARNDWAGFMARSHDTLQQALSYITAAKQVSRNPLLPINGLFTSGTPMADLLTCVYRSERCWSSARTSSIQHAVDVRDSTMIRMEGILNFRPKNLAGLSYLPNNKGQIRKLDGIWEVEVPFHQFKNWRNCRLFGPVTSRRNFHKRLKNEAGLYDLLDRYFLDVRNDLPLFDDCPFAFVTQNGTQTSNAVWRGIVRNFGRHHVAWNPVMEKGIPAVASLNPYAFRHIKASDILQNSKALNKVEEAAFALQTSETMIIDHYGLLLPDQALASSGETFTNACEQALKRLALEV